MKLGDLRIGNWVQIDDLPEEQITLETFATLLKAPATLSCFNGVQLTEKHLLDFSFEQYHLATREFNLNDCKVIQHYEDGFLFIMSWWKTGTFIKYVHQLQNLYSDLRQEELSFKKLTDYGADSGSCTMGNYV